MKRSELLREMGLTPVWRLRTLASATAASAPGNEAAAPAVEPMPPAVQATPPAAASIAAAPVVLAVAPSGAAVADAGPERGSQIARLDWDGLAAASAACGACGLCRQRKQAVLGVGDRRPDWLVIGEGPGEQEDERGEPFVGPAGQLLDAMLAAVGLRRGAGVYIANAVKCRPPGNRNPTPEEIAACRPFLLRQIALLAPKLIILLGRSAVASVLERDAALAGMRGRIHRLGETPVVVTYHPAYLLRTLSDKARAWEDLCLARRTLNAASAGTAVAGSE